MIDLNNNQVIVVMELKHIGEILAIHLEALPDDFNTRLGPYYLKKIFFKESINSTLGFGYPTRW